MTALILFCLAAFFNACMDAFENENFGESIFRGWNKEFWSKRHSWDNARQIFGYKLDAWHLAKSAMIVTLALACILYTRIFNWWGDLLIYGAAWNIVFVLFYHKIFKIK